MEYDLLKKLCVTVAVCLTTAGGFNNTFQVPMPVGVPEGVYPVKTALYVNGTKVRTNNAKLQIVMETGLMRGTLVAAR